MRKAFFSIAHELVPHAWAHIRIPPLQCWHVYSAASVYDSCVLKALLSISCSSTLYCSLQLRARITSPAELFCCGPSELYAPATRCLVSTSALLRSHRLRILVRCELWLPRKLWVWEDGTETCHSLLERRSMLAGKKMHPLRKHLQ